MKKVLTLSVIALLCFLVGTIGIYVAMPSLSPDKVDSTRSRLDSLGLLPRTISEGMGALSDSLTADSIAAVVEIDTAPTPEEVIRALRDSINTYRHIVRSLSDDTSSLSSQIAGLTAEVRELTEKDFDATELSKSLAKLDGKQLGSILAGLQLNTIELLYQKASARERTRLIESMSPDQAARFVRTLVNGPQPEAPPENAAPDGDAAEAAAQTPSTR